MRGCGGRTKGCGGRTTVRGCGGRTTALGFGMRTTTGRCWERTTAGGVASFFGVGCFASFFGVGCFASFFGVDLFASFFGVVEGAVSFNACAAVSSFDVVEGAVFVGVCAAVSSFGVVEGAVSVGVGGFAGDFLVDFSGEGAGAAVSDLVFFAFLNAMGSLRFSVDWFWICWILRLRLGGSIESLTSVKDVSDVIASLFLAADFEVVVFFCSSVSLASAKDVSEFSSAVCIILNHRRHF